MNQKILLLISFVVSLSGIIFLYVLDENIDFNEVSIEELNSQRMEGFVKVRGEVIEASSHDKVSFIKIQQPSTVEVVIFDDLKVYKGENVEVIGEKENNEIIAKKIRVVK